MKIYILFNVFYSDSGFILSKFIKFTTNLNFRFIFTPLSAFNSLITTFES